MNILFCLDTTFSRKNGGIAAVSLTLKKGFEKKGHKCFFISAKNNQVDSIAEQYYLPIASTDSTIEENRSFFQNIVKEKQIDVIINQNGGTPSSLWALEWSKDLPVRKLTVYHSDFNSLWSCHRDCLLEVSLVKSLHLQDLINSAWKNLFRFKYRHLLRRQYRLSDKLVFLTDKYFAGFKWFSGIVADERFMAIYNPVENDFDVDEIAKENMVLFVGRLSHEKRIDYLLKVWAIVSIEHSDWNLCIVGDGPMKEQYEQLAVELNLNNVTFVGFHNPLKYYKCAKIFCLTSQTEGFSLVLVESMIYSCVPIAFNSYACASDIIDNEKCGFLVAPFDIDFYAKKLALLMDNEEHLVCMSKEAKEKAQQFSLERIVAEWENVFNS